MRFRQEQPALGHQLGSLESPHYDVAPHPSPWLVLGAPSRTLLLTLYSSHCLLLSEHVMP